MEEIQFFLGPLTSGAALDLSMASGFLPMFSKSSVPTPALHNRLLSHYLPYDSGLLSGAEK